MESLFVIPNQHFSTYYDFFYGLAFFVTFLILIYEGYKMKLQRFQWIQWLLLVASVRIFFIIGTKMATFSGQEWNYFFNHFYFPPTEAKTAFGGLLLALVGFGLAKIWLRYPFKVFDAFAMAIPVGMAIQRVGCLLVGCCFGYTTTLPWGLHYGKFSPAFYHQVHLGIIDPSASYTLGVHPIPLYIIFYCLIVSVLVWKNKKRFKASGNLLLFSIILLLTARFFVEFLRHPFTNAPLGSMHLGLKVIQWCLLAVIIILIFMLVIKEKKYKPQIILNAQLAPNYLVYISFIFFLSLIIYAGRNWFIPIEKISLILIIIPVSLVLLGQLFQQLIVPGYRLTSIALVILSFIIMAQTVEVNEVSPPTNRFIPEAWNSFGLGYGIGSYDDVDYGCEGDIINRTKHTYNVSRIEYNRYFRLKENQLGNLGIRYYYGHDIVKNNSSFGDYKRPFYSINPYFKYDFRIIGFGLGFHHGKFDYKSTEEFYGDNETLPMLFLRIGSLKKVYGECYIMDHSLLYTPVSQFRLGLGVNLGQEFNSLHFGIADIYGQGSGYISSRFLIRNDLLFEPNISFQMSDGRGFQGGFGIHYLFGKQTTSRKSKNRRK